VERPPAGDEDLGIEGLVRDDDDLRREGEKGVHHVAVRGVRVSVVDELPKIRPVVEGAPSVEAKHAEQGVHHLVVARPRPHRRDLQRPLADAVSPGAGGRLEDVRDQLRERARGVVEVQRRSPNEARLAGRLGNLGELRSLADRDDGEDALWKEDGRDRRESARRRPKPDHRRDLHVVREVVRRPHGVDALVADD
jgi:hypothetical protein